MNENDKKLEKLTKLAELLRDDTITPSQAKQLVELLINLNKQQKDELVKTFDGFTAEAYVKIQEAVSMVSQKHADALLEVRQLTNKQKKAHEDMMAKCMDLLTEIKSIDVQDGIDGKDADEEKIVEDVLARIPKLEPVILDDREKIVNKINTGKEKDIKIDASQIKNLPSSVQTIVERAVGQVETPLKDASTGRLLSKDASGAWLISASGGGGGGTWGSITGTLSDQTDLQSALDLKAPLISPTFATSITGSYLTASEILITDASKNIVSAPVATYPSLTELSYIKGLTSAVQTQLNSKELALTFSTGLTRATNTITNNLSTGVSGGQTVVGGTDASNNLTLSSTTNATKGKIVAGTGFAYHENTNRLSIGTTTDTGYNLGVVGTLNATQGVSFATSSGDVQFGSTSNTGQVVFSVKQSTNTGLGWLFGYDSLSTNGFYIYSNETTLSPNFNLYAGATLLMSAYGTGTSGVVFNESGADKDFRIESDLYANTFFVDASTNRIGIHTNTPGAYLDIQDPTGSATPGMRIGNLNISQYSGSGNLTYFLDNNNYGMTFGSNISETRIMRANVITQVFNATGVVFNDTGANYDFRVEGDTDTNLLFLDASVDSIGVGTNAPSAKLHAISTTEQLRLGYNASNYLSATINSTGSVTFDLTGTTPEFTFSDAVNVPDEAYGAGWNGNTEVPTKNAVYDEIETKGDLVDVQVFTSNGTWTKPSGAKFVEITLIGGGAGGGSGRKGAASSTRIGGAGGAGGGYSKLTIPASLLGASETVTVGAGGAGGASQTVNSTNGNAGASGGNTTFGSMVYAGGGQGGAAGNDTSTQASIGGISNTIPAFQISNVGYTQGYGGGGGWDGDGIGGNTEGGTDYTKSFWVAGGAGGGGIDASNTVFSGGLGGNGSYLKDGAGIAGGAAGSGAAGGNGTAATANSPYGGGGGGGGGARHVGGNAYAGGNGALYGAGGGGGGASTNAVGNSGAGGTGANGIAIVVTYF